MKKNLFFSASPEKKAGKFRGVNQLCILKPWMNFGPVKMRCTRGFPNVKVFRKRGGFLHWFLFQRRRENPVIDQGVFGQPLHHCGLRGLWIEFRLLSCEWDPDRQSARAKYPARSFFSGIRMPVIILKQRKGLSRDQKRRIVKEFTETMVTVAGVKKELVTIMIEEKELEDIGKGGVLRCDE